MKRTVLSFLLMITLAATGAAQMNYELTSPYLTYSKTEDGDIPVLIETTPEPLTWPRQFTITVGGDTTLGSTDDLRKRDDCFENVAAEKGYGWFFSGLESVFATDDMTLVNFEGTLTEQTEKKDKLYNFKGPAEYTDILTLGSVEAVNIANNHTLDYGEAGREDTVANLQIAGLTVSGNGTLGIYEKDGVKVGMTGYCFPYSNGEKDISRDVQAPVSYTHLDVYKRQCTPCASCGGRPAGRWEGGMRFTGR